MPRVQRGCAPFYATLSFGELAQPAGERKDHGASLAQKPAGSREPDSLVVSLVVRENLTAVRWSSPFDHQSPSFSAQSCTSHDESIQVAILNSPETTHEVLGLSFATSQVSLRPQSGPTKLAVQRYPA